MNRAAEQDIAAVAEKLVRVPFGWLSDPDSLPLLLNRRRPRHNCRSNQTTVAAQELREVTSKVRAAG